ncbi:aldehyde dehydrogenase family protein, partial [Escherichia coli]|uniref:aldehyde dehydrogenase family protein n=1 Tax=Escherichia coli TaxID=562 RepID=UPI00228242C0
IAQLRVGPGLQQGGEENEIGPLVSSAHQKKVLGYIDLGVEEGATLVADGRNYQVPGYPEGYYVGGTLFDHVKPSMRIYREEIFGPVVAVTTFKDADDALALANDTLYGLGAGGWS